MQTEAKALGEAAPRSTPLAAPRRPRPSLGSRRRARERCAPRGRRGRVLLALPEHERPRAALFWARMLTLSIGSGLSVCAGARQPEPTGTRPEPAVAARSSLSGRPIAGAAPSLEQALSPRHGEPSCIVIPAEGRPATADLIGLARAARCPVLLARAPACGSRLLMVSAREGSDAALLEHAAQLADTFGWGVLALRQSSWHSGPALVSSLEGLSAGWRGALRGQPPGRSRRPPLDISMGVSAERPGAIIERADLEETPLLLLGLAPAHSLRRAASDRRVEAVLEHSQSAVLLVPSPTGPARRQNGRARGLSGARAAARSRLRGPLPREARR